MKHKHHRHQANTGADHAQRHVARELMFHQQGHGARDHQQKCQPAETMMTVMVAVVMMVAPVMMPVTASVFVSPGGAALFRTGFVQREFIAHTDIDFAHSFFLIVAASTGRALKIIIQSSKVNHTHQKIII
jgi:hypothetical protein